MPTNNYISEVYIIQDNEIIGDYNILTPYRINYYTQIGLVTLIMN